LLFLLCLGLLFEGLNLSPDCLSLKVLSSSFFIEITLPKIVPPSYFLVFIAASIGSGPLGDLDFDERIFSDLFGLITFIALYLTADYLGEA